MKNHNQLIILAGGQGSRFWPISRKSLPKQFLTLSDKNESLIQATVRRLLTLVDESAVTVVSNSNYTDLVKQHLPASRILAEPCARNTAAAIGYAAIKIMHTDPEAVMIVLPADHAVGSEDILQSTIKEACKIAVSDRSLVTIGVKPEFANTAYGYIQKGALISGNVYHVHRFYEKPNLERAQHYFSAKDYYWNSGMFVWRADVILEEIKIYLPELYAGLLEIKASIGQPNEQSVLEKVYPQLESISIDFGVLEHSKQCSVIAAEPFGWNDIGSWDAWAKHFEKDEAGNLTYGDVLSIDSEGCIIRSEKRFTAVLGATDLVVIDAGDALLVCPKDRVQDVKKIVEELGRQGREELI